MCTPDKFILGMGWVGNNEQLFIKPPDKGKKGLQRDLLLCTTSTSAAGRFIIHQKLGFFIYFL